MAGRTENTSPIVDQAAPTDTTTEESSEKTVQSAQAAAAVQVASPGRGEEYSIAVETGMTYRLVDPVLRFTQDDGNLVVHWRNGGHTTLEDYLVFAQTDLPPALTLADGSVISFDQLVASIEGFDLGVIAPAAAAAAEAQTAGGAFNTPFDGGDIGEGPGITDLLLNTGLQFGLLEFLDEVFPLSGEEVASLSPPLADDVVTPADRGRPNNEGIPQEVIALLGTVVAFSKELTVDGIIGDSDLSIADFGGSDAETSLENLTFTLTSDPTYGTLSLVTSGGASIMSVGDTFTSADTIFWVATDEDVSEFKIVPDATFTYQVTDASGFTADATVLITIDDEPTAEPNDPESNPLDTVVDEAEGDGPGDTFTPVSVDGNVLDNDDFGFDGPGSPAITDVIYDGTLGAAAKDTSVAGQITFTASNWTLVIITDGVDAGDYTFTQTDQFDHSVVQGTNPVDGLFTYTIQDGDGDTASAGLTIRIIDDVPTAADDADSVTEDGPLVATGNVITAADPGPDANSTDGVADTAGADGIASIAWTGVSGVDVAGAFGTLTVGTNGDYSYALDNGDAAVQGRTRSTTRASATATTSLPTSLSRMTRSTWMPCSTSLASPPRSSAPTT